MPPLKNHYTTLGLPPFAGEAAVRTAYRKLARTCHPDLHHGDKRAEERFKAINEAYEVLSSADKRAAYDAALRRTLTPNAAPPPASSGAGKTQERKPPPAAAKPSGGSGSSTAPPPPKPPPAPQAETPKLDPHAAAIHDLFETFLKKTTLPNDPPKKAARPAAEPRRGEDITVEAAIFPHEAEGGTIKPVHVQHVEICRRCSGSGKLNGLVCPACHGEKTVARTQKLDVRIPSGVKNGSKVRVAGEGGRGRDGGENGDLYLLIQIAADPGLRVDGADVHYTLTLSIPQAVLGVEIDVPTLSGPVKLAVPPRSAPGKVLRMKGRGASASGGACGDQLVTIALAMPQKLSPKELALYQALADLHPGD